MSQFGSLDALQQDIDGEAWPVAVRIHGVNAVGHESENAYACEGKDIPWLQEILAEPVWADWEVTYRDVIVLDRDNVPVAVYNLTSHDLGEPANYAELKALLQAAADRE
ncbi:MAG: hypothetical protein IH621_10095 [Krumholzibacteria bacterium]|nr:hypothetical protein [Candidatus Krumholzibacteria bacterium]